MGKTSYLNKEQVLCQRGFPQVPLVVKNLPATAGDTETQVRSLDREDPLEEEMATHYSIPACRIPVEEPGELQSKVHRDSDTAEATQHTCTHTLPE